ncbi:hypothetical protein [Chitiniphilus shinanonensis]|uniref:hypothetical protein n=1 Tax=Chitiniphilus shinanonensis TaxID=553088 RepID=UPI0033413A25
MSLELEEGTDIKEVASVLASMDAQYEVEDFYLTGNFKKSNCYFVFREFPNSEDVVVDGVAEIWRVGMNGAFHCSSALLLECSEDIKLFLLKFSAKSSSRFALSFQYESLYVLRDRLGVHFIKEMIG